MKVDVDYFIIIVFFVVIFFVFLVLLELEFVMFCSVVVEDVGIFVIFISFFIFISG